MRHRAGSGIIDALADWRRWTARATVVCGLAVVLSLGSGVVATLIGPTPTGPTFADFTPAAAAAPVQKGPFSPIVVSPTPQKAIVPVRGTDGRFHVVYELLLTNTLAGTAKLKSVSVRDIANGRTIQRLGARAIIDGAHLHTLDRGIAANTRFEAFGGRLLVVTLSFKSRRDIPEALTQRFEVDGVDPFTQKKKRFIYSGGKVEVSARQPPVLLPPLGGKGWLASDACCTATSHVTATIGLKGKLQAAERFAVDWIKMDAQGRVYRGNKDNPRNWVGYGARVRTVGAGVVAVAHDGEPDQIPGRMPSDLPLKKAPGNYVTVEMDGGFTAVYAHLVPGSVRVKVGDVVRAGQVIGRLGNSGASGAPHLHFHIVSGRNVFTSDGFPYEIDTFKLAGKATTRMFEKALDGAASFPKRKDMTPVRRSGETPLNFDIVDFPG